MAQIADETSRTFGAGVRVLRRQLDMTQAQLAEDVSAHTPRPLDHSQVARIEAGRRPVTLAEAVAFAAALGRSTREGQGVYGVLQAGRDPAALAELDRKRVELRRLQLEVVHDEAVTGSTLPVGGVFDFTQSQEG